MVRAANRRVPLTDAWAPLPYQETGVRFLLERGAGGLFLNPGRGKTAVTLAVHSLLLEHKQIRRTLVVCPKNPMTAVWPAEIAKWSDFHHLQYRVLHGPHKDKIPLDDPTVSLYIINFDGLRWLAERFTKFRGAFPFDMLVVDESSYLKNIHTQRFKLLKPLLKEFRRRYILTGDPAPNSLLDLFGPVLVMDLGATFGPYITRFREEYFYPNGYGGYDWQLKADGEERIRAALAPRVYTLTEDDQKGLPPITYNTIRFSLSEKTQRLYREFKARMRLEFDGATLSAVSAGVLVGKLQQFTGGAVYETLDGEEPRDKKWLDIHEEKIEALLELLEERQGRPTVVVYSYRHELQRLRKAIPGARSFSDGKDVTALLADWNAGKIPVLLAQERSMSHGLNMQGVEAHVVWFYLTTSNERYRQLVRRVYRMGQKYPVVVHHLVAENTWDERALDIVDSKARRQTDLLTALRDYWRS